MSGADLGAYCRERGLFPQQLARWRQVAEDANHQDASSLNDTKELQRQNQKLRRQNRRLERELQKKEKALVEAATPLMLVKKRDPLKKQGLACQPSPPLIISASVDERYATDN